MDDAGNRARYTQAARGRPCPIPAAFDLEAAL
jgi:hypothetical protein